MGLRGSNKILGVGKSKKPSRPDTSRGGPARCAYRAPAPRDENAPGTPDERAAFAAEIRAKTKLFGGAP